MTAKQTSVAPSTENDPRWAAVVARDRSADGTFYYSVKTTGVYCRPSCGARRAEPAQRTLPPYARRGGARGVSALQALPARSAADREAAGGDGRRGLPDHRGRGVQAGPGHPRPAGRPQPPSFPSHLQGRDRTDPQGLRRRPPDQAGTRRPAEEHDGDGSDLRRRFQFRRPVLRPVRSDTGHDPLRLPRGRAFRRHPLRRRRVLARVDPGGHEREGRLRHPARRRPGSAGARSAGSLPSGDARGRGCRVRGDGGQGGRLRRRPRPSASTCRWTCVARRSSSVSGGRSARFRRGRRPRIPPSRPGSAHRSRYGRWRRPARPTRSPSPSPAIAS